MKSLAFLFAATIFASPAFAGTTSTATLDVSNMTCAACPITVRKALEKVPGVGPPRSTSRRTVQSWPSIPPRQRPSC